MLCYEAIRVLKAIGNDIKSRDDVNRLFKGFNFQNSVFTAALSKRSISNALVNLESSGFIEIEKRKSDLDNCLIKMTKNGFHEYLKHLGGLMKRYAKVAALVNKGLREGLEISKKTNQENVIINTILEEWADLGYITVSKTEDDSISIDTITSRGQSFIITITRN